MNDSERALLTEILAELRLLNARLTKPACNSDDDAAIALLREIVAAVGDHVFCAADLLQRVPSPQDERLRAAIVAACGSLSPRRIGKLLRKLQGREIAGLRVVRTGRVEREGAVWQIVAAGSVRGLEADGQGG